MKDLSKPQANKLNIIRKAIHRVKKAYAAEHREWMLEVRANLGCEQSAREINLEAVIKDLERENGRLVEESYKLSRCRALRGKIPRAFIDGLHRQFTEMTMKTKVEKLPYPDRYSFNVVIMKPPVVNWKFNETVDWPTDFRDNVATVEIFEFALVYPGRSASLRAGHCKENDTVYVG